MKEKLNNLEKRIAMLEGKKNKKFSWSKWLEKKYPFFILVILLLISLTIILLLNWSNNHLIEILHDNNITNFTLLP